MTGAEKELARDDSMAEAALLHALDGFDGTIDGVVPLQATSPPRIDADIGGGGKPRVR